MSEQHGHTGEWCPPCYNAGMAERSAQIALLAALAVTPPALGVPPRNRLRDALVNAGYPSAAADIDAILSHYGALGADDV